jgi:hypothetical protein
LYSRRQHRKGQFHATRARPNSAPRIRIRAIQRAKVRPVDGSSSLDTALVSLCHYVPDRRAACGRAALFDHAINDPHILTTIARD